MDEAGDKVLRLIDACFNQELIKDFAGTVEQLQLDGLC